MKNYQLSNEIIALFNESLEIGDVVPFFSISIYPKSQSITFQGHYANNALVLAKVAEVYKCTFEADRNGYLWGKFKINDWLIETIFC